MREAFHALLPDFGDEAALAFDGPAAATPSDGFVPFLGASAPVKAFDELHVDAAPPQAPFAETVDPVEPAAPSVPGDAVALQSMLSDAFSPDVAGAAAAEGGADGGPAVAPSDAVAAPQPEVVDAHQNPAPPIDPNPEVLARDEKIAELTAQIEAMDSAHAAEVARLVEQAVPAMADGVAAAVRSTLGAVLAHPLMNVIEAAAVDRFCAELSAMAKAGEGVAVHLSGPERLLEAVREGWPESLAAPEMETAETVELVAIADTAVLSTRLEEARSLLLGGRR